MRVCHGSEIMGIMMGVVHRETYGVVWGPCNTYEVGPKSVRIPSSWKTYENFNDVDLLRLFRQGTVQETRLIGSKVSHLEPSKWRLRREKNPMLLFHKFTLDKFSNNSGYPYSIRMNENKHISTSLFLSKRYKHTLIIVQIVVKKSQILDPVSCYHF